MTFDFYHRANGKRKLIQTISNISSTPIPGDIIALPCGIYKVNSRTFNFVDTGDGLSNVEINVNKLNGINHQTIRT